MFILIDEYIMIYRSCEIPHFNDISFQNVFLLLHPSNISVAHKRLFPTSKLFYSPYARYRNAILILPCTFQDISLRCQIFREKCGGLMTIAKLHVILYNIFMRKNGFQIVLWSVFLMIVISNAWIRSCEVLAFTQHYCYCLFYMKILRDV